MSLKECPLSLFIHAGPHLVDSSQSDIGILFGPSEFSLTHSLISGQSDIGFLFGKSNCSFPFWETLR